MRGRSRPPWPPGLIDRSSRPTQRLGHFSHVPGGVPAGLIGVIFFLLLLRKCKRETGSTSSTCLSVSSLPVHVCFLFFLRFN